MSNEPLGIAAELAANRAKYQWKRYIAPQDRVFVDATKPVTIVTKPPPPEPVRQKAVRIRCATRPRGSVRNNLGPEPDHRGRVSDIVSAAADAFGVTVDKLVSPDRSRRVAYPRFAAMHIMSKVLRISLSSIGRAFNRDHTTCLAGIRRAAELRRTNKTFAGKSRMVARDLRRRWAVQ